MNSSFQLSMGVAMTILMIHFVGDFVLQTQEQAMRKSSSFQYLLLHVFNYSLFTAVGWFMFLPTVPVSNGIHQNIQFFWVFAITFVTHLTTDFFTSRWTKSLWERREVHDFFVAIGFDQFLHMAQLLYLYQFISI